MTFGEKGCEMELLPAIDILGGRAVRLARGDYARVTVYNDDPVDQAKRFEAAGATWLHAVDLDGAREGRQVNLRVVEAIAEGTGLRVECGGGVRDLEAVRRLRDAGVARVVLGSALVTAKDLAAQAVERFGADALCAGIDARGGEVAIEGWRQGAGVPAEELAAEMAQAGFAHLVFTDIARDGMQTGIDATAYERMARVFGHPVVASGGVASMDDLRALAAAGGAIEGVIAGRAIYEGTLPLEEALAFCN